MKYKTDNFLFSAAKLFLGKKLSIILSLIALCFTINIVNKLKYFKVLRSYTNNIIYLTLTPINKFFYFVSESKDLMLNLSNHQSIIKNLKKELHYTQSLNDKYARYVVENVKLKQLLNFVNDKPYQFITAKLIGFTPGPFNRTASISAGYSDSVEINDVVVNDYGVVGKIIEVDKYQAKILLITDYNSRVPVITSISRQLAILSGNGNKLSLNYISNLDQLIDGELIITSGDGTFYPADLPVARINIDKKNICIESLTNYIDDEYLSILKMKR